MEDTFGRKITYLRVSVTELCNLRCRYCMPEDGVCKKNHLEMLTEEETIQAIKAAASLGVKKIRITGGEPLVKKNIVSICEKTAQTEGIKEVCITTNAVLLPQMAETLKKAGVSRVNISLDTLNPEKFKYITRIGTLDQTLDGLHAALDEGFEKVKINVVLIGGFNDDEIPELAHLTMKYPVDVRFIELMPMYDGGEFGPAAYLPGSEVVKRLPELEKLPADGGVASLYRLPKAFGNVGLINPVSAHFCNECNRVRLTSDGKIKPCLHSSAEFNIKGLDYDGMLATFKKAINAKPERHKELSNEKRSDAGRNMNEIGG